MRNDKLKSIDAEIETIRKRLAELQTETIAELTKELTAIQTAVFNAKNAQAALDAIAAMSDTSK